MSVSGRKLSGQSISLVDVRVNAALNTARVRRCGTHGDCMPSVEESGRCHCIGRKSNIRACHAILVAEEDTPFVVDSWVEDYYCLIGEFGSLPGGSDLINSVQR